MTNKPEPNTRAGEALERAADLLEIAKDRNYSNEYIGNLLRANLDILEPNTRPLTQQSELVERLLKKLRSASDGDRMYERPMEWSEADQLLAYIAKLQADGDKLAGALEKSRRGWSNVLELGLLPAQHQGTALELEEAAAQALTEWKDRA